MRRSSSHAILALSALTLLLSIEAEAQTYPKPGMTVRHIIPWGAGGATDTAMRGFVQHLERHLGAAIVTENIPGALGAMGLLRLKAARPDGYTVGTLTYDVLTLELQSLAPIGWRDFEPLGMVTEHASALVVSAKRFESLETFRDSALRAPGALRCGNVGTGGIWHQHAAAMERALGIRLSHVPYERGSGAQLSALLGSEVDAIVTSLPAALPYVRDGSLRVLAVMASARDPLVPDVPTFREKGFDVVFSGFRVLAAPRGTPPSICAALESAMHETFDDHAFQSWAEKTVIGAKWRGAAETREYLEETSKKVEALMKELDMGLRKTP
jgi:putative tricarboxylic transport membrane protein